MATTEVSTLCRLAPKVASEPRFCTHTFDHEKAGSGDTRFFLRKSLINLNNVLLRFLIRRARDGIYHFLKFMTVGVMHGISKEIAHFTCQFVHETQIDIEIKQHLYCDIRETRAHFSVNDSLSLANSLDRRTLRAGAEFSNRLAYRILQLA